MSTSEAVKVKVRSPAYPHDQIVEMSRVPCSGEHIIVLGDRHYVVIRVEHTPGRSFDAEIDVVVA